MAAVAFPQHSLDRRLVAHRSVALQHGVMGGLAASVVMGLFLMAAMAIRGDGFFRPLELVGSLWYGELTTGLGVGILGLLSLLALGVALGAVWASVFSYVRVEPLFSGAIYGVILALLMAFVLLPLSAFVIGDALYETLLSADGSSVVRVSLGSAGDGFALWMILAGLLLFGLSLGAFEEWADRRRAARTNSAAPVDFRMSDSRGMRPAA